jgi:hypothetical protein
MSRRLTLQCIQPLAQRGLQCTFPALFDVDAAPEALQPVQTVPGQPGLELAVGANLFLQGLEGLHPGGQFGLPRTLCIDVRLPGPAFLVIAEAA